MSHKPPICSKTRGATAGSGESQLSTELEGAGFARAPLSQADESGEAPWVAGSSGVVSVVCVWGGPCASYKSNQGNMASVANKWYGTLHGGRRQLYQTSRSVGYL